MAITSTRHGRHPAGLVGWFLLLVAAIVVATAFDDPRLVTPALTDLGAWPGWLAATDPIFTTGAIVRLVLIGLTWYLLGATTILVVARLSRNLAMMRIADALAVPVVRRVVGATLGVGLAASMVTGATGPHQRDQQAAPAAGHARPATMDMTESTGPGMQRTTSDQARDTAAAATMTHVQAMPAEDLVAAPPSMTVGPESAPDAMPADSATATPEPAAPEPAAPEPPALGPAMTTDHPHDPAGPTPAADGGVWTVRSGDHLWHIAEQVMATHLGRTPDDAEVTPYWRRLVDHNRPRLPDPRNPDLVLPGLAIELPDPQAVA